MLLTTPSPISTSKWKTLLLFVVIDDDEEEEVVVFLSLMNIEHEVFAVIPVLFTSAALSDFSASPNIEMSGSTPFILIIA
jgi:hypothetical protein